ncbi:hypothetical protein Scep_003585 [Stephania cephalantha]|uniref:Uncharacterized protein n=1 Tax=Stephania cephalantha TaxID=152367 RepID=A0AAP0KQT5_9MAGN
MFRVNELREEDSHNKSGNNYANTSDAERVRNHGEKGSETQLERRRPGEIDDDIAHLISLRILTDKDKDLIKDMSQALRLYYTFVMA